MKSQKTMRRLTAALGLVVAFSVEAAAQVPPPAFSVVAVGNVVTIEIGPIPGLPSGIAHHLLVVGSSPGGSEIGSINLPPSVTRIVVDAPNGTYYLRAQAFAGGLRSDFSPEVSVTAGLPVCTAAPIAPVVTPTVAGGTINLDWTPVAGASQYDVLWSQFSGGAPLLVDRVTTIKHARYAGRTGTFFARVHVTTPCGSALSDEVSFTITSLALGSGPRTPDPPPNSLLPFPTYLNAVVQEVARRYPGELASACKTNNQWLFLLIRELRTIDSRWGMNWKRGWPGEHSTDIVTFNPSSDPDVSAQEIYLADVIGAECEANRPGVDWGVTEVTWNVWFTPQRSACANRYCAAWTLEPYLRAGFLP